MLMDPLLGIPISELMNPEGKKWVENDMHQTQKKHSKGHVVFNFKNGKLIKKEKSTESRNPRSTIQTSSSDIQSARFSALDLNMFCNGSVIVFSVCSVRPRVHSKHIHLIQQ